MTINSPTDATVLQMQRDSLELRDRVNNLQQPRDTSHPVKDNGPWIAKTTTSTTFATYPDAGDKKYVVEIQYPEFDETDITTEDLTNNKDNGGWQTQLAHHEPGNYFVEGELVWVRRLKGRLYIMCRLSPVRLWRGTLNEDIGATTANLADGDLLEMDGTDTTEDVNFKDPVGIFADLEDTNAVLALEQDGEYFIIQAPCP
jgi:hypothetical protein